MVDRYINKYWIRINQMGSTVLVLVRDGDPTDNFHHTTFYVAASVWPQVEEQLFALILLDALPRGWQPTI